MEVVPGIEFATGFEHTEIHLLGYLFDPASPALTPALRWVIDDRRERNEKMAALLRADGVPVTAGELYARYPHSTVGRPHFAVKLMDSAIVLEGWMLADKEPELSALFDRYDCAWETEDPVPDEYPKVPVKLRNDKFSNALNVVTNMYSLPAYNGVDPNPLMAPFYVLFYGLMGLSALRAAVERAVGTNILDN